MISGDDAIVSEADAAMARLAAVKASVEEVVIGQEHAIELVLAAILGGGHALLVGAPGLAKTRLVQALAVALGLESKRVQFTPDLMPADILGSEVLEESASGQRSFRFIPGPVFCQLLMADEINRASPRTQSALLQAMQEGSVTVAGAPHPLPAPFHVLATQNPIEQEGTYPLPEAQLDRFLLQIDIDYPDRDAERSILLATTGVREPQTQAVLEAGELAGLQQLIRRIPIGDKVVEAILDAVRYARPTESKLKEIREGFAWGPGPRAGQALMLATRARALLQGRLAPSVDDVIALLRPALTHRVALTFTARAEGVTVDALIDRIGREVR